MRYEQVCILDFILYFILEMCLLSSCDHVFWHFDIFFSKALAFCNSSVDFFRKYPCIQI